MKTRLLLILTLACCGPAAAAGEGRAFVAARHIRAGEAIRPEALRETAGAPGADAPGLEELSGAEAVRPIRAGEALTRLMLRPARAVRAGDKVRVTAGSGKVKVSAWFTALQGGAKGELIDARNGISGRVCRIRVEGPGAGVLGEAE